MCIRVSNSSTRTAGCFHLIALQELLVCYLCETNMDDSCGKLSHLYMMNSQYKHTIIFCLRSRASSHQTWLIKRPAQSSPNPQKVVITMPRPPFFTANSNFNTHNSCSFCLYFSHVLRAPTPGPTVHFLSPARSRWM